MIVKSAILYEGQIFVGKRHPEIMMTIREIYSDSYISQDMQGFFTDTGVFLNREDAKKHAKECGQLKLEFSKTLTSEDLW